MCHPQPPPDRATVLDRHINSSPMTNTQSSGFHVVEINGNGGQTIIYWIVDLLILFVIAGGIRVCYKHWHDPATHLRQKREKEQRRLER